MKFYMGYEKNMSFLVIPKSLNVGEKVEKIGQGSFNLLQKKYKVILLICYQRYICHPTWLVNVWTQKTMDGNYRNQATSVLTLDLTIIGWESKFNLFC